MTSEIQRLFVYGSLCPGQPNEHILKKIRGSFHPGYVRGFLKEKGWGAKMGFPGILLDPEGNEVHGYVFSSLYLKDNWDSLDAFEGGEYQRTLTQAVLDDGTVVKAFIYVLK